MFALCPELSIHPDVTAEAVLYPAAMYSAHASEEIVKHVVYS